MSALVAIPARRREEVVVLASLALAALIVGSSGNAPVVTFVSVLTIGTLVAWIVWQDLKFLTISDSAILALGIVALALRWAAARSAGDDQVQTVVSIAIDAALPSGLLFLFREAFYRAKGFDGLGFGDVKLAASGGVLVGTIGFSWALFIASALGLCFVAVRRLTGKSLDRRDKIAFGAILAPALWLVWVAEQSPALLTLAVG